VPRKSISALSTPSPQLQSVRLQPPAYLTKAECAEFVALVVSNKPNHFVASDLPLLAAYAQISCQLQHAAKMIHKGVVFENKVSPWISIQERLIKSMVALSMRLRLSPQARAPNNPTRPTRPINAYDMMVTDDGNLDNKH
jgi:phage terminase small subunit